MQTTALPPAVPRAGPGLVDEDAAIDPSKLVYDSLLGRGAFGEVHYGRWEAPDGTIHEVAIKVLLATRYGSLREHEQVCLLGNLSELSAVAIMMLTQWPFSVTVYDVAGTLQVF